MAERPVFISIPKPPFYEQVLVEFEYFGGFALSQKQRCIRSLHEHFQKKYPEKKLLEVSSKGWDETGNALSAFFLPIRVGEKKTVLESVFQGSKVFEKGGPYTDLYWRAPWEAKSDQRLRESGNIIGFSLGEEFFPNEPKDFFYNWIYVNALYQDPGLFERAMKYNAFTDIEFNPKKSLNCQARSVAIVKGLQMAGKFPDCMASRDSFLKTVYGNAEENCDEGKQISLFDL